METRWTTDGGRRRGFERALAWRAKTLGWKLYALAIPQGCSKGPGIIRCWLEPDA